ncbi:hypothetical protein ACWEO1_24835 [Kitasatospora cineracea]
MPLLVRRVQIRPQHPVDQRLERTQPRRPGRRSLAGLRPHRLQGLLHRQEADSALLHHVDQVWLHPATRTGLFGTDGTFLISITELSRVRWSP